MIGEIMILQTLFCFVLGHLCGSIPSGLWIVRLMHGIDIREYGSKNIGATNVFRTVGTRGALLVLLADLLKGMAVVAAVNYFFGSHLLNVAAAVGALLGHNYSAFLGLKGGKGVATGLGLLIYLLPHIFLWTFGIWLVLVLSTRYVSLGSIVASFCAPFLAWYYDYPVSYIGFAAFAAFFIILRHSENIKRLLNGTESKIKAGKAEDIGK